MSSKFRQKVRVDFKATKGKKILKTKFLHQSISGTTQLETNVPVHYDKAARGLFCLN